MKKVSMKRRQFLKLLAAGTCGAAAHQLLVPRKNFMAFAAPASAGMLGSDSVFIVLNMAGGASLNVAPVDGGAYRDKMPTIFPETVHDLNGEQFIHGSLSAFKAAYDDGDAALFNLVGYNDHSRSHADSSEVWFRGMREGNSAINGGWAARLTCQMSSVVSGISLSGSNTLTQGECNPPLSFSDFSNFGEGRFKWTDNRSKQLRDTRSNLIAIADPLAGQNAALVTNAMHNTDKSVELIKNETSKDLPDIESTFPTRGFGATCHDAARVLAAQNALGTRFIFMQRGGFDTHSDEQDRLTGNLDDINAGLVPLIETIKALGMWDKVVIVTMSEFSRTFENGSAGADHGHAGPLLVMGGRVQGGVLNAPPSASMINSAPGYFPNYEVDFRQIYKEIVVAMGFDGEAIFPGNISYTPYSFLA